MTSVQYQTLGTYKGQDLIVNETYKPAAFGRAINPHRSQTAEVQDRLEQAASFMDMGNIKMTMEGLQTPQGYVLNLEMDVSNNAKMCRDASAAATFSRIAAFFGVNPEAHAGQATPAAAAGAVPPTPPPTPPQAPQQEEHKSDLPPPSFLGDCLRAIGHLLGLLMDYAVLGAYICCRKVKEGVAWVGSKLS